MSIAICIAMGIHMDIYSGEPQPTKVVSLLFGVPTKNHNCKQTPREKERKEYITSVIAIYTNW